MFELGEISRKELLAKAEELAYARLAELKLTDLSKEKINDLVSEYRKFFYTYLSKRANVRP